MLARDPLHRFLSRPRGTMAWPPSKQFLRERRGAPHPLGIVLSARDASDN
jgi:hypothetical protein